MPCNHHDSLVADRCKSHVLYIHTIPKTGDFVEIGLITIDFHTHELTLSSD